jgi:hypothetical protein
MVNVNGTIFFTVLFDPSASTLERECQGLTPIQSFCQSCCTSPILSSRDLKRKKCPSTEEVIDTQQKDVHLQRSTLSSLQFLSFSLINHLSYLSFFSLQVTDNFFVFNIKKHYHNSVHLSREEEDP